MHEDRVVRGDERIRGDDHFVAGVNPHRLHGRDQGGGAAGSGNAPLGAQQLRIGRLKFPDLPAATAAIPVTAAQDLEDIGFPDSRHSGHLGPRAALVAGRPAEQAGLPASAASAVALGLRSSSPVRADPAAAV